MQIKSAFLAGLLILSCAMGALADPWGSELVAATAAVHGNDQPVATLAALTPPIVEVMGREVSYGELDGSPVKGYLARPASASADLPGLIVIHEWWGLNDNIRQMAERLAGEGYVALAVDLYRGRTGSTPKEAMGLMTELNENVPIAESNLRQAYAYLNEEIGAPRIGVIGWCLGGRWSLRTALLLPAALDAVVMYYGSVVTDEVRLVTLQMPVMGNFAENDPIIPLEQVNAFEATLKRLGKEADVKVYAGARHAFANPSGTAYDQEAADDAWRRSLGFLSKHLGKTGDGS